MDGRENIWLNLKRTKQRERVYRILSAAERPMSVSDIYQEMLIRDGGCAYAVSTVYRALQAFEEQNMVLRTTLPDSDTALYEWNAGVHIHYAICLKCHKRIPLRECPFQSLQLQDAQADFQITGHKIEIYGYCGRCRDRKEQ